LTSITVSTATQRRRPPAGPIAIPPAAEIELARWTYKEHLIELRKAGEKVALRAEIEKMTKLLASEQALLDQDEGEAT
jgi:hypothetical protein